MTGLFRNPTQRLGKRFRFEAPSTPPAKKFPQGHGARRFQQRQNLAIDAVQLICFIPAWQFWETSAPLSILSQLISRLATTAGVVCCCQVRHGPSSATGGGNCICEIVVKADKQVLCVASLKRGEESPLSVIQLDIYLVERYKGTRRTKTERERANDGTRAGLGGIITPIRSGITAEEHGTYTKETCT